MADITAVVVSSNADYSRRWPGLEVLVHHLPSCRIPDELHAARLEALSRVRTSHFFYLDDDDDLPPDYLSVLGDCLTADKPIAYTDEMIISVAGNSQLSKSIAYDSMKHYMNPMLLHHLVLCQTSPALEIAKDLPRGAYWTEFLLYWPLAQLKGAHYVPRVGYIWKRSKTGQSLKPLTVASQMASRLHHRQAAFKERP